ncbi:MAG: class I SAM-dependent methyltransferase [Ferruginibacter sp.]
MTDNNYTLVHDSRSIDFESIYIAAREKENRIYSDEQVALLPSIEKSHKHFDEWNVRKRSSARLLQRLQQKNKPLSILEVGCGNGWLSARLSVIKNSEITATDINKKELAQARRVFSKKENISLLYGDIRQLDFHNKKFDVIVFAASVQYFAVFDQVIGRALELLNKDGEIHIVDTRFYHDQEITDAANRTAEYYRSIGYHELSKFYFHHSFQAVRKYRHKVLFDPDTITNKLFRKTDPFPWIVITV